MNVGITDIRIDKIRVGKRKRQLDTEKVNALSASIGTLGLLNPVHVDTDYRLVAGYHRNRAEGTPVFQAGGESAHLLSGWHYTLYVILILAAKVEETGREWVKVDPKHTSQLCSRCGETVKKSLAVRVHRCPHCGLELDRDVNAAKNVLARALDKAA